MYFLDLMVSRIYGDKEHYSQFNIYGFRMLTVILILTVPLSQILTRYVPKSSAVNQWLSVISNPLIVEWINIVLLPLVLAYIGLSLGAIHVKVELKKTLSWLSYLLRMVLYMSVYLQLVYIIGPYFFFGNPIISLTLFTVFIILAMPNRYIPETLALEHFGLLIFSVAILNLDYPTLQMKYGAFYGFHMAFAWLKILLKEMDHSARFVFTSNFSWLVICVLPLWWGRFFLGGYHVTKK